MMKKIFGMAAMSALVLGMFACSDGEDGINGQDGKDGADGVACTVKALKDESGFKVLCDGDSVGVLKNGTAGKDGKAGADGKDGADGEDGADGSGKAGSDGKAGADGEDGTGCTAKAVKDGFAVICGKDTVGTIKNGEAGDAGEGCSLSEGDDGVLTVACGKKSVNVFKAVCGDGKTSYDPETHMCFKYWDSEAHKNVYIAIPRCKDHSAQYSWLDEDTDASDYSYDPRQFFCNNNVLVPKCELKDKDGKPTYVEYDAKNEYCDQDNNKISEKVLCGDDDDGKKFKRKPSEYCYRNADDPKTKMRTAELETCGSGNGQEHYNPVEQFCAKDNGKLGDKAICADPADADKYNIDIRYMASEHLDTHEGQLCDSRDWKIYKTKTIGEKTWMAENLRYVGEKRPTADLDSSSFWFNNQPNNEEKGRLYLWSAVIDSAKLAEATTPKFCGYGEPACTFDKPVQGVCPDGWHVPGATEQMPSAVHDGTDCKYWRAGKFYTCTSGYNVSWTSVDVSSTQVKAYAVRTTATYTETWQKSDATHVRCVKNDPEEVAP